MSSKDRGCPQHLKLFGAARCLPDQPTVHVPRGEVGALDVARARPQKLEHLLLIPVNGLRLIVPITRPSWRRLTICRCCQPSWGRFLVGGRPLPLYYSGTFPHTSTIASPYPPHPSGTNGGGECPSPLPFFGCSKASMAASVSPFASPRAPPAVESRFRSAYGARILRYPCAPRIPLLPFVAHVKSITHPPEPYSVRSRPATPLQQPPSAGLLGATTSISCPP